jgi:DNA ligase D-like protein (predicted 3'-phosphoesterase)
MPEQAAPIFVIQQHQARNLHYDLRLEVDGVLVSWAVPRGPSVDPRVKRLAVRVPDHGLEHAQFEGRTGSGRGAVLMWDTGAYRNIRFDAVGSLMPMPLSLREGTVEVWLTGQKLHGGYTLVRLRTQEPRENWLLIKKQDAGADAGRDPVSDEPRSVLSGRSLDEIAPAESEIL